MIPDVKDNVNAGKFFKKEKPGFLGGGFLVNVRRCGRGNLVSCSLPSMILTEK
jgi:hypothetical protein